MLSANAGGRRPVLEFSANPPMPDSQPSADTWRLDVASALLPGLLAREENARLASGSAVESSSHGLHITYSFAAGRVLPADKLCFHVCLQAERPVIPSDLRILLYRWLIISAQCMRLHPLWSCPSSVWHFIVATCSCTGCGRLHLAS